jgi:hypothetical protein
MASKVSSHNVVSISKKKLTYAGLILLLVIVASVPALYFYTEYQKAQMKLTNPSLAAAEELKTLIQQVGKLMILPDGEAPTLATVSDVSKLKGNKFFERAQNGDKVLIYSKAKKAILYRPSANKLVEVAPLEIADQQKAAQQPQPTATKKAPATPYNVVIFNGTAITGLGSKFESTLESNVDFVKVTDILTAKKNDYPKTIVVDLSKKASKEELERIAKTVNGTITNVAYTETAPKGTDIVIVVGTESKPKTTTTPAASPSAAITPSSTPEPTEAP